MGIEKYIVKNDKFEVDDNEFPLGFPCCACKYRRGTDQDEPCISCEHNLYYKVIDDA